MADKTTRTFARRARLSSKAIVAALALSVAAAIALYIARPYHDASGPFEIFGPVSDLAEQSVDDNPNTPEATPVVHTR